MIRIIRLWRVVLAGGLIAMVAGGCGKSSEPKAAVTPQPEPIPVAKPEPQPEPKPEPLPTLQKPAEANPSPMPPPMPEVGPKPALAGTGTGAAPAFAPPTSATFNPPTAPTANPADALQPPAPQPAVQQSPPAATTPQPPTATTPQPGESGKLEPTPKEPKYPKEVGGRDLNWYLKEVSNKVQPDPQLREAAIRTIPVFGPDARRPAVQPLTDVLYTETDPGVLIAAISIISSMGFEDRREIKPAITALVSLLKNRTVAGSSLRMYAVRSIASFGHDGVSAVSNLKSIVNDPSWETRAAIAEALGSIGAPPPTKKPTDPPNDPNLTAAKTLLDYLLIDSSVAVRLEAVKSLLAIGPPKATNPDEYKKEIKPYLESVEKRLTHEKGKTGDKTMYVWLLLLQIMYDDRVLADNVTKIGKMIETPEGNNAAMTRLAALQALGILGKPAKAAVPQIIPALSYPEAALQAAAMVALARIGNEARAAVPELEKVKAKVQEKPAGAPADWKPDTTLQTMAADTIDYITGKKKIADVKPEEKKDDKGGEKK